MQLSEYSILLRNNVTIERRPLDMKLRAWRESTSESAIILVTKRPGKVMTFRLLGRDE